jgi:hypothetical protein
MPQTLCLAAEFEDFLFLRRLSASRRNVAAPAGQQHALFYPLDIIFVIK